MWQGQKRRKMPVWRSFGQLVSGQEVATGRMLTSGRALIPLLFGVMFENGLVQRLAHAGERCAARARARRHQGER